jgi:hypothetical protein
VAGTANTVDVFQGRNTVAEIPFNRILYLISPDTACAKPIDQGGYTLGPR